ncbi:response regulator [Leptolyngbya sp. NIES-2104]|uniref:response regulator n=1 Tax=Leptolyngbya sp. NIES-2104 TaxID=1552121 RepID=UPI0006EC5261|nr:response regulator [Leptolyngbya sp. NIES-2104]GAP97434.1 two-component hybrid sensor and regulator [Leptolyngbya sp. NIES-2104]
MTTEGETRSNLSIRILLIEDNEPNRRLLEDYLIYQGYTVLALATGIGFDQALIDFQPQVVLLDLKLPDIDGCDILEQMQQNPEWRQIPVIVVSARAFIADQRRALNLGARRYLVKPIRLQELLQVIQEEVRGSIE